MKLNPNDYHVTRRYIKDMEAEISHGSFNKAMTRKVEKELVTMRQEVKEYESRQ